MIKKKFSAVKPVRQHTYYIPPSVVQIELLKVNYYIVYNNMISTGFVIFPR